MRPRILTLGHSPDPDDAFMLYGLARKLIPTDGFEFEHLLQDIQTLNERATRGELDITAISIHAYAYVSDRYALLPSGASMGDGYGPMLVAARKFSKSQIAGKRIAVPEQTNECRFVMGRFAPATKPGQYALFISVGQRDGTPRIALPLADDDGQRRYRLGQITLRQE